MVPRIAYCKAQGWITMDAAADFSHLMKFYDPCKALFGYSFTRLPALGVGWAFALSWRRGFLYLFHSAHDFFVVENFRQVVDGFRAISLGGMNVPGNNQLRLLKSSSDSFLRFHTHYSAMSSD